MGGERPQKAKVSGDDLDHRREQVSAADPATAGFSNCPLRLP